MQKIKLKLKKAKSKYLSLPKMSSTYTTIKQKDELLKKINRFKKDIILMESVIAMEDLPEVT